MAWSKKSRHERGYGKEHERIRAEMMRTIICCQECEKHGRDRLGTIADHIIPLSRGGTGDRSNYQLLCKDCSDEKTARDAGRSAKRGGGVGRDGRPTDANHPWNRG